MSEPASMAATPGSNLSETPVAVKIFFRDTTKKIFVSFKDLGPQKFPVVLRTGLGISSCDDITIERYSDSAGAYTALESHNNQAYKTLYRAAKAKLKLRLRIVEYSKSCLEGSKSKVQAVEQNKISPTAARHLATRNEQSASEAEQSESLKGEASERSGRDSGEDTVDTRSEPKQSGEQRPGDEAPIPKPFTVHTDTTSSVEVHPSESRPLSLQSKNTHLCSWSVYCNICGKSMLDAHFHCTVCEDGDYDLCEECVEGGRHCPGQGHWLIKRNVIDGKFVSSVTEKVPPKAKGEAERGVPGAFDVGDEKGVEKSDTEAVPQRACNACIELYPETECITCTTCEDFDLCIGCQIDNKHGHHPAHTFAPVTPDTGSRLIELLCSPNRGTSHAAFCDGCDKKIVGVRHKCLTCPDWDYCSECFESAELIHPKHRFAPIYEPLPLPSSRAIRHSGIYCDGHLCKDKEHQTYIQGVRYKCVICNDTDFCANCEASPNNKHNKTHPLIKFRSPVRNVSVMTSGEDRRGLNMPQMGDVRARRTSARGAVEENVTPCVNVATRVEGEMNANQKVNSESRVAKERIQIKDLLAEPIDEKANEPELMASQNISTEAVPTKTEDEIVSAAELKAHYATDIVADGTRMAPGIVFRQVWTLFNPGPHPWPVGCSVMFVGGDNTLNIDTNQPSTAEQVADATRSNSNDVIVPEGGLASFGVNMRAPERGGRAISYWRVRAPDGTPFGHRLWCDITVETPESLDSGKEDNSAIGCGANARSLPILTAGKPTNESDEATLTDANPDLVDRLALLKNVEKMLKFPDWDVNEVNAKFGLAQRVKASEGALQPAENDGGSSKAGPSRMVFPQLDKESPAASTYKEPAVTEVEAEQNRDSIGEPSMTSGSKPVNEPSEASTTAGTAGSAEQDLFEDAESLRLEDSDGETFLTDEEYDILDASDEELP